MIYEIHIDYIKFVEGSRNPYDPPMTEFEFDHEEEYEIEADNGYEALEVAKDYIEDPHFDHGGGATIYINGIEVYSKEFDSYERERD